jgi:single-strand DNA-binding protein
MFNKVIIMGRLTRDPEIRYTQSNVAVARFSLAVNRVGKQQEGQPAADFFDIVAWRQTAEFVSKYFQKGQQVLVEGNLRNNNWTDQQGQKQYRTEVHIDHAYFAEGRREASGTSDYTPAPQQTAQRQTWAVPEANNTGDGFYTLNEDDEDLPF